MSDRLTALLGLFDALRCEIQKRSDAQASAVQLAITAFGVLGGFAFSEHAKDKSPLLLVPIVGACLGIVWFDHAAQIRLIGAFIKDKLQSEIEAVAAGALPDWEAHVQSRHRQPLTVLRTFGPTFLVFVVVPIVAMAASWPTLKNNTPCDVLFGADAALLGVVGLYLFPHLRPLADPSSGGRFGRAVATLRDRLIGC